MNHHVDAGDVVREFYAWRERTTKKPPPVGNARHGALATAGEFIVWCREQEIEDPIAFLRWRLERAEHAGHPISIKALRSPAFAERWREWGEGISLDDAKAKKLLRQAGSALEQNVKTLRILTPGMEAAKHPYAAGRSEMCLVETELTGGFHPASRYCPTCPVAVRCAAKLYKQHGFDVVALRRGALYALPREIAAAAVR